jgi:hypothetical protein
VADVDTLNDHIEDLMQELSEARREIEFLQWKVDFLTSVKNDWRNIARGKVRNDSQDHGAASG